LDHNYAHSLTQHGDNYEEEVIVPADTFDDDTSHMIEWNTGRRIIEVGFFVNKLIEGCSKCGHSLNLRDICGEQRFGLGSFLHIKCNFCSTVTSIPTGKRHSRSDKNGHRAFDVNSKVALGLLNVLILTFHLDTFQMMNYNLCLESQGL
jgi:hypothetical protein